MLFVRIVNTPTLKNFKAIAMTEFRDVEHHSTTNFSTHLLPLRLRT
jgi:hypothetical protein